MQRGFTLIELVLVMVILGTVAMMASSRFVGSDSFASMAAQDQLISAARYAQQIALVRGPTVNTELVTTATNYQIEVDNNPIVLPSGNLTETFPDGSTVTAATILYTSLGDVPAGPATLTITVPGEANRTVTIETTGYAH